MSKSKTVLLSTLGILLLTSNIINANEKSNVTENDNSSIDINEEEENGKEFVYPYYSEEDEQPHTNLTDKEIENRFIHIMQLVDKNKDQKLDHDELRDWIMQYSQSQDLKIAAIFLDKFDANHNKALEWAEVLQYNFQMSEKELMQEIEKEAQNKETQLAKQYENTKILFRIADVNQDNFLDVNEMAVFVYPSHYKHSSVVDLKILMSDVDYDNDGKVTLEEFRKYHNLNTKNETEMDKTFHKYDKNNNGVLDPEEIQIYFSPTLEWQASNEARDLIEIADRNKDNAVDMEEMLNSKPFWLKHSFFELPNYDNPVPPKLRDEL